MHKGGVENIKKNNSPHRCKKAELNDWYKNNSPNGWIEGKFIGRHRDNLLDRKAVAGAS